MKRAKHAGLPIEKGVRGRFHATRQSDGYGRSSSDFLTWLLDIHEAVENQGIKIEEAPPCTVELWMPDDPRVVSQRQYEAKLRVG